MLFTLAPVALVLVCIWGERNVERHRDALVATGLLHRAELGIRISRIGLFMFLCAYAVARGFG